MKIRREFFFGRFFLDLSYSLLEGLWYSDKETGWLGGCGEGEERVERSGEGAESFGEREW